MEIAELIARRSLVFLFLPITFVFAVSDAAAQVSRQVTAIERRVQTMDQQSRQFERDNMGRDGSKPTVDSKRAREIKNEIGEDLNGLQKIYNEMILTLQERAEPSAAFLNDQMTAVEKRAVRLKNNLAFPKSADLESNFTKTIATGTRKGIMRTVAKMIYDLITNPVFENTSGLDVKLAAQASQDIDALIIFTSAADFANQEK